MCVLYEAVVENVKREMGRQGLNQAQLAERLGKRQGDVSRLLRQSDMRLSTVEGLAEALGVPFSKLLKVDASKKIALSQ